MRCLRWSSFSIRLTTTLDSIDQPWRPKAKESHWHKLDDSPFSSLAGLACALERAANPQWFALLDLGDCHGLPTAYGLDKLNILRNEFCKIKDTQNVIFQLRPSLTCLVKETHL